MERGCWASWVCAQEVVEQALLVAGKARDASEAKALATGGMAAGEVAKVLRGLDAKQIMEEVAKTDGDLEVKENHYQPRRIGAMLTADGYTLASRTPLAWIRSSVVRSLGVLLQPLLLARLRRDLTEAARSVGWQA